MYSNYAHKPQNVYLTNIVTAKIAKLLSVSWSVDFVYDDDARVFGKNKDAACTQFKSLLGMGLLVNIGNER